MAKNRSLLWVFVLFCAGACSIGRDTREHTTQEWILNAQKPIQVIRHNQRNHFNATNGNHYYTMIDRTGKVHLAKGVRFQFPEVIE